MKNNTKVLIVEDNIITAKAIESNIKKMGYHHIRIALEYNQAIRKIKDETPDLILLDIDLNSKKTGIDIAKDYRVMNQIPIIYLTKHIDDKTLNQLTETNPKNYLSKPFKYKDLFIAITLAIGPKKGTINIGYKFSFDLESENLFYKKDFIKLTPKETALLKELISGRGYPIESKMLEDAIWKEKLAVNSLRNLVNSLRKKLNDKDDKKIVVTVPSFGYKLSLSKDET